MIKKCIGMRIRNVILILIFITISLFSACSEKNTTQGNSNTQKTSTVKSNENTTDQMSALSDFFMDSDGQSMLSTAWAFMKAYFNSDSTTMKLYLVEGEDADAYKKAVFDKINYLNLQWSFSQIVTEREVYLTYIFEIEGESLTYFDLHMKKEDNEWKVSSYGLEK